MRIAWILLLVSIQAGAVPATTVYGVRIAPRSGQSIPAGHAGISVSSATGLVAVDRANGTQAPVGIETAPVAAGVSTHVPLDGLAGLDFQTVASCEARANRVVLYRPASTGVITLRERDGTEVALGIGNTPRSGSVSGTTRTVQCLEFIPLSRSPFTAGQTGLWVDAKSYALKARSTGGTDTLASCQSNNACVGGVYNGLTCVHIDPRTCAYPTCSFSTSFPGCSSPDTDGDGLSDAWEAQQAVDINCDGILDSNDLALPGANPAIKDIYLHWDYLTMAGTGDACTIDQNCFGACVGGPDCVSGVLQNQRCINNVCTHTHAPTTTIETTVVTAFAGATDVSMAAAPVIAHIDTVHAAIPEDVSNVDIFIESPRPAPCGAAADFYALKAQYSPPNQQIAYHYTIFGHGLCSINGDQGGTGEAEQYGNDALVTMGTTTYISGNATVNVTSRGRNTQGTWLHETGHNLNLRHGGGDDTNNKPNYVSVMNYSFQLPGILRASVLGCVPGNNTGTYVFPCATVAADFDFSHEALPALDKAALVETAGIGSNFSPWDFQVTKYFCPSTAITSAPAFGGADWDCDGTISGTVAVDINGSGGAAGLLTGYNDWVQSLYNFQCQSAD